MTHSIRSTDALLLVDPQNDFFPGGALGVPAADRLLPLLNRLVERARAAGAPVYVSRNWHPADHISFESRDGPWPPHCMADTEGAQFHPDLHLPEDARILSKGTDRERDAYSAFDGTGLADRLRADGADRIWIGGLAQDYGVRASALDAVQAGFETHLVAEATRAVNLRPGDGDRATADMRDAGVVIEHEPDPVGVACGAEAALATDLYQLTMAQAYWAEGMEEEAVFDLFVRHLPEQRGFLVAAGLDDALSFLETLRFDGPALEYLRSLGKFSPEFLDYLAGMRFTGDVYAMPEGTPAFPDEPLLEVVGPLPEAQIAETVLINRVQFQTIVATKAARMVEAAAPAAAVDFGLRRAHGLEAGVKAARAACLAGFASTSNVLAGQREGLPVSGTMAHSYVLAHDEEMDAFRRFTRTYPETVLLVDTYDTLEGVRKVIRLAEELGDSFAVSGVRLDSGDLESLARQSRELLDRAGLRTVKIFASGDLDEHAIEALAAAGAPIDAFGIGTALVTSADAPYLNCAYKLVQYAGAHRMKLSSGKATLPGRKQVYRRSAAGDFIGDTIALHHESQEGEPLLHKVMENGRRVRGAGASLEAIRRYHAEQLDALPAAARRLADPQPYRVEVSGPLRRATEELTRRLKGD